MGRILGPRGMTTKQLEQETGCKIMVRGKGSMRDKKKVRTDTLWFSKLFPSCTAVIMRCEFTRQLTSVLTLLL